MRNLLAFCLIATAFAPVATAATTCLPAAVCVTEGSVAYGDCETAGYEQNRAIVDVNAQGVRTTASALTFCYNLFGQELNLIFAGAVVNAPVGRAEVAGFWYEIGDDCFHAVRVSSSASGTQEFFVDCVASPPKVPAALP